MSSTTETVLMSLLAPLSGQAVPLEQVPDDVFSQKIYAQLFHAPNIFFIAVGRGGQKQSVVEIALIEYAV